jgi:ABC-2 type transport system ATP-binding protein
VGALVEEPAFYPSLSGTRNLLVYCRLRGFDADRIPGMLAAVGLEDSADRDVGGYSQGMRKRLAIAAALLPNPRLLVLDEPANGLDPMGMRDVRQLLRHLADQGRTVFVSSHMLAEVEQACDEVVMIRKGSLVFQGPLSELLQSETAELVVAAERAGQHRKLRELCGRAGYVAEQRGDRVYVRAPSSFAGELNRLAMDNGITLVELRRERLDLEQVFFDLTDDQAEVVTS